jgi:hypothetical protein
MPVGVLPQGGTNTDGTPVRVPRPRFDSPPNAAAAPPEIVTCTGGHQIENVDEHELRAATEQVAEAAAARARSTYPELSIGTCRGLPRRAHPGGRLS